MQMLRLFRRRLILMTVFGTAKSFSDSLSVRIFPEILNDYAPKKNIAVQISSNVNISEDGSISINRIDIKASDESSALAAEKLIRSEIPGEYEITAGVELHHE